MQFRTSLAAASLLAVAAAQSSIPNLTSLIGSTSQLSGLGSLLKAYPEIATAFANLTNVTFFAPNNAAIQKLEASGALTNVNQAYVLDGLQYHVLPSEIYALDISSTPAFPHTILNNTMLTNVTGGQVVEVVANGSTVTVTSGLKLEAQVVEANLNFTGGVVHVIDSVLTVPVSLVDTLEVANLTALAGAVVETNLLPALEYAGDLTIFAPTNAAFGAIASAVKGLSVKEAASILEYHVINGTVAYSSTLGNGSVTTVAGQKLNITVEGGAVFVNSARVVIADILFANGVIHVIDAVLNPNNTAMPNPSATTPVIEFPGASSGSVPYTSVVSFSPTETIPALTQTTNDVAKGYTHTSGGGAVNTGGAGVGSSSSSSKGAAAAPTGFVGPAILFGGAALLAELAF